MVFDSLNYLHSKEDIATLHEQVYNVLKPNGIFVYDFTTPRNSKKAIRYLNDEQDTVNDRYSYHRSSRTMRRTVFTPIHSTSKKLSNNPGTINFS